MNATWRNLSLSLSSVSSNNYLALKNRQFSAQNRQSSCLIPEQKNKLHFFFIHPSSSSSAAAAAIEASSSTESIMDTTTTVQRNNRQMKKEEEEEEVVLPEIGEDLIMEILLRLQPDSVLRFKFVSKSWYTLITHPSFFRNHAAQFRLSQLLHPLMEPPGLLLSPTSYFDDYPKHSAYTILPQYQDQDQDQDQDQEPENSNSYLKVFLDKSLPAFGDKFSDCFLINSCNGLLLYRTDKSSTPNQYTVFNPITKQYKEVPLMNLLETFSKPNEELTVVFDHPHIVFDPSISLSYKLLAVLRGRPPYTHSELYVYSSNDIGGSWRHLVSFASKYFTIGNTFMFNGVFYWLCHRHLIYFDFVKETVSLLPLPPAPVEFPIPDVLYFGEFGGRIRLIQEYRNGTIACGFDILEMELELELDSRNWTMKTRVNLEADQEIRVKVMHLYKTEKGEEVALLNVDNERVIPFNITTNTLGKELTIQTIPYIEHLDCLNAFPFTPTLYPLLM